MKFKYVKSQFELPPGRYLARFEGATLKEDRPGDRPRLGQDGLPLPPAMLWNFTILQEGEQKGKKLDKLTGRVPSPKSGCGRMLSAISDTAFADGCEVDLSHYVGCIYKVTIGEDGRLTDSPPPVRAHDARQSAPAATPPETPPPDGPPGDDAPARPAGDAKWDFYSGERWVRDATSADVQRHIADGKLAASDVWVKPHGAGNDQAKTADGFGFASGDSLPY